MVFPYHVINSCKLAPLVNKFKGVCEFHDILLVCETWICPSSVCFCESLKLFNRVGELANPIRLDLHNITGRQRQIIRYDDARAGRDNRSDRDRVISAKEFGEFLKLPINLGGVHAAFIDCLPVSDNCAFDV